MKSQLELHTASHFSWAKHGQPWVKAKFAQFYAGGGGLRILPKKKWNPYNFDNIDKVRKDEEKHREEETAKKVQTDKQEALYRLEMLRKRSRQKFADDSETIRMLEGMQKPQVAEADPTKNVNLFDGGTEDQSKTNKEYEKEKKQAELDSLKKVIPELFFGQSALDAQGNKPWYSVSPEEAAALHGKKKRENKRPARWNTRQMVPSKVLNDPLTAMKGYLDETNKHEKDKLHESQKLLKLSVEKEPPQATEHQSQKKRPREADDRHVTQNRHSDGHDRDRRSRDEKSSRSSEHSLDKKRRDDRGDRNHRGRDDGNDHHRRERNDDSKQQKAEDTTAKPDSSASSDDKSDRKKKKHKRDKSDKQEKSVTVVGDAVKSADELRRERRQREENEKVKAVNVARALNENAAAATSAPTTSRKYNNTSGFMRAMQQNK